MGTTLLAATFATGQARAQVFSTLHAFSGRDGATPAAALVQGRDGVLYGTTQLGGESGYGTLFGMTAAGKLTMVYELTGEEGADVFAPLRLGRDGQLYGTTALGGSGVLSGKGAVFSFSTSGSYTPLHFFSGSDGAVPQSGLTQGRDGSLYGVTTSGGGGGRGTVFAISPSGELRTLHAFSGADGGMPVGELAWGRDGWLYGVTVSGGANKGGTVFRVSPSGDFAVVYAFGFDSPGGRSPRGGLVRGPRGNFYGTTEFDGDFGYGAIFRLSPDGALTTLHSFAQSEGGNPLAGLILGRDGNLYGTTSSAGAFNSGTVFVMTPAGTLSVLHAFTGGEDGGTPVAALLQARDGRLYGTTSLGGAHAQGTVFRLALPGPASVTGHVPVRGMRLVGEEVVLSLGAAATDLSLRIAIRKSPGLRWARPQASASNKVWQSCRVGRDQVVCTFALRPRKVLTAGRYTFGVQLGLTGFPHFEHADTFELSYTSRHQRYGQAGGF